MSILICNQDDFGRVNRRESNATEARARAFAKSQKAIAFPQPLSGGFSTNKRPDFPRNQPERHSFAPFQKGFQNTSRKPYRIRGRIHPTRLFQKVRVLIQNGSGSRAICFAQPCGVYRY